VTDQQGTDEQTTDATVAGGPYAGWTRYADRVVSPTGRTVFFSGPGFVCCGCGEHTGQLHEQFMLVPDVWDAAVAGRAGQEALAPNEGGCLMLCVGCAEERLGRPLVQDDFDWRQPLNRMATYSRRLRERMGWETSEDAAL